ncbi:hypothetical protein ABES25_06090 [Bacillus gobiensis]|uniref:hypothetical protein n=1 Tax=Bacillus gobiensis TaxID=1441095 RepID=UPI003D1EB82C
MDELQVVAMVERVKHEQELKDIAFKRSVSMIELKHKAIEKTLRELDERLQSR